MTAPPYMKLYVADYLGDTHHLTALEHGAYLLLLMAMWRAGGTLPAIDSNLARLARLTPEEWAAVKPAIWPFFKVSRMRLTQKRLAEEIAKYENISGKRSEAKKGGLRQKANKINAPSDDFVEQTDINCRHNQNQSQKEERTPSSPPLGDDGDQVETTTEPTLAEPDLFDPVSQDPDPPPDDVETAFNAWNELARRLGLPVAKVLDEGRRRSIRKRLAEGGLQAWAQALRAIASSRHCRGGNDRKWRADLDFVCQPKSWRRLLEGFYGDDADDAPDLTAGWTPDQWRRALAISRETGRWDHELGPPLGEPGCRIPPEVCRELRSAPRLAAVEGRAVA